MNKFHGVFLFAVAIVFSIFGNPVQDPYSGPFISEFQPAPPTPLNWSIELDRRLGTVTGPIVNRKTYYLWVASQQKMFVISPVFDSSQIAVVGQNIISPAQIVPILTNDTIRITDTVTTANSFIGSRYWKFVVRPVKTGNSLVNFSNELHPYETAHPSMGKRFDYSTPYKFTVVDEANRPVPQDGVEQCTFYTGSTYSTCYGVGNTDDAGVFRDKVSMANDTLNFCFSGGALPEPGTGSFETCWAATYTDNFDTVKVRIVVTGLLTRLHGPIGSHSKTPWRFQAIPSERGKVDFIVSAPSSAGKATIRVFALSGMLLSEINVPATSSGTFTYALNAKSFGKKFVSGTYIGALDVDGVTIARLNFFLP
jgi:hypothetical protein